MLRWSPLDWCWAGGRGAVRSRVHRLLLSPASVGEVQLGARDSSGVGGGRRRRRAWCPDEGSFVQGQPVAPAATATCASSTAPPRFRTRSAAARPLGSSGQAGGKAARAEPTTAHAVSGTRAGRSPPRSFRGFPCRLVPTAPPLQGQGPGVGRLRASSACSPAHGGALGAGHRRSVSGCAFFSWKNFVRCFSASVEMVIEALSRSLLLFDFQMLYQPRILGLNPTQSWLDHSSYMLPESLADTSRRLVMSLARSVSWRRCSPARPCWWGRGCWPFGNAC